MRCHVCHRPVTRGVVPGPEWGLTHRACFARVDAEAEALEHGVAISAPDPEWDRSPMLRLVRRTDDLTGQRFGSLVVVGRSLIMRAGILRNEWEARCDCGRTVVLTAYRLKTVGVKSCKPCASVAIARKKHMARRAA